MKILAEFWREKTHLIPPSDSHMKIRGTKCWIASQLNSAFEQKTMTIMSRMKILLTASLQWKVVPLWSKGHELEMWKQPFCKNKGKVVTNTHSPRILAKIESYWLGIPKSYLISHMKFFIGKFGWPSDIKVAKMVKIKFVQRLVCALSFLLLTLLSASFSQQKK